MLWTLFALLKPLFVAERDEPPPYFVFRVEVSRGRYEVIYMKRSKHPLGPAGVTYEN